MFTEVTHFWWKLPYIITNHNCNQAQKHLRVKGKGAPPCPCSRECPTWVALPALQEWQSSHPNHSLKNKKQTCPSRVLLYMDSVPHSCITTILNDSLVTWNLRKKSPDIVFKFETANWWRLLLTLTYGHAGTRGAKPAHPSPLLPSFSRSQGSSLKQRRGCSIHFCWL